MLIWDYYHTYNVYLHKKRKMYTQKVKHLKYKYHPEVLFARWCLVFICNTYYVSALYILFFEMYCILALLYFRFASLCIVVYLLTPITNQYILHTYNIMYDLVVHHNIYVTFTHIMFALQCFVVVRIIHAMYILYWVNWVDNLKSNAIVQ